MSCNKKLVIWFSDNEESTHKADEHVRIVAECNSSTHDCGFHVDIKPTWSSTMESVTDKKLWHIEDDAVLKATLAHLEHIRKLESGEVTT